MSWKTTTNLLLLLSGLLACTPPVPEEEERSPEAPATPTEFESDWLAIPYDDPTDPRTVLAVYGLRRVESTSDSTAELVFGPSFNEYFAAAEGFNVYSADDPEYAYSLFVEPTSIAVDQGPDLYDAIGDEADLLDRTTVTLTLPTPLQDGARYSVRAIGGTRDEAGFDAATMHQTPWTGYPLTAGINAGHFVHGQSADSPVSEEVVLGVMGLRSVERVAPDVLRLVVGGAAERSVLADPEGYSIEPTGGGAAHSPSEVGVRVVPEIFLPGGPWPFPDKFFRHEIYLRHAEPLPDDSTWTLRLAGGVTSGRSALEFRNSDLELLNPHLKINQEGYLPGATGKKAYYGAWMGTLGSLDVEPSVGCRVHDATSGDVVLQATLDFRYDAATSIEGSYSTNESRENLYTCDFSDLRAEGSYFVSIEGAGRSYEFRIADDAFERAYQVAMRGLFIQRSNSSFDGTESRYLKTAGHGEDVEIPYMDDGPVVGGHYDAGDYNPRVHWQVAMDLMLVYELFPDKFGDGRLDIPESGNGIPDILDEAAWSLRPFFDLQDEDGGIGGSDGTAVESYADPNFVETIERDPWRQHSYDKEAKTTLVFAALAAQASRLWEGLGESAEAQRYLDAALLAYGWAGSNEPASVPWALAWAAAELAHTTGEAAYLQDYEASGYTFAGVDDDDDGIHAAMSYALLPDGPADPALREAHRTRIGEMASRWADAGDTFAYPVLRHPWSPTTWGTGAYPNQIDPAFMAHGLERSAESLQRLHRSIDLTLGVNPLNLSWITGLGDRPIVGPAHLYGWSTYQGLVPPGLQSEGPNRSPPEAWFPDVVPALGDTPTMYNYYDVRYCILLNEGVVPTQSKTAMTLAALLPDLDP